jgi:lipoic acid synthetase
MAAPHLPLPPWLRFKVPSGRAFHDTSRALHARGLATVCEQARCPNLHDCWSRRTATVMILGDTCTRGCRFCAVATSARPAPPDPDEPRRVSELARELGWAYVVLTSVDRDDLPDAGAAHYAQAVRGLKAAVPGARVEVLIPDLGGEAARLELVLRAGPDVLGHNLETVRRLTPLVRDRRASYDTSLKVLELASHATPRPMVKSALLLGLGETRAEVSEALADLRAVGCEVVAIGQYLQPGKQQVAVNRYVAPDEFDEIGAEARALGFTSVASAPLVRSSYHSREFLESVPGFNANPKWGAR